MPLVFPDPSSIAEAADCLQRGGLVGMPTETVYGLAGLATSDTAVAAIYALKGRPRFNPLIVHCDSIESAAREGRLDVYAQKLAQRFWPGPLTLVVPVTRDCRVRLLARAGLDTLALRVPALDVARDLICATQAPLAAPSANLSGRLSPTCAQHVAAYFDDRIAMILDAGPCRVGLESTIIACLGGTPHVLRPGALPQEEIEEVLGLRLSPPSETLRAPGMLASHYAPRARVHLNTSLAPEGSAVLDFARQLNCGLDLSPSGDLQEAAAHLFAYLHRLDGEGVTDIFVAPIPEVGLGVAINDRLRRAACVLETYPKI